MRLYRAHRPLPRAKEGHSPAKPAISPEPAPGDTPSKDTPSAGLITYRHPLCGRQAAPGQSPPWAENLSPGFQGVATPFHGRLPTQSAEISGQTRHIPVFWPLPTREYEATRGPARCGLPTGLSPANTQLPAIHQAGISPPHTRAPCVCTDTSHNPAEKPQAGSGNAQSASCDPPCHRQSPALSTAQPMKQAGRRPLAALWLDLSGQEAARHANRPLQNHKHAHTLTHDRQAACPWQQALPPTGSTHPQAAGA